MYKALVGVRVLEEMNPERCVRSTVTAACTCQKHVTNVSQHGSMGKSDGDVPFSLSCHKVVNYSDSAKTLY